MDFYHFTAREYLPAIACEGLSRGEVPITMKIVRRGVWLTTDDRPDGHGLTDGGPLTDRDKRILGVPTTANVRFPDKRAVRFKVSCPKPAAQHSSAGASGVPATWHLTGTAD